HRLPSPRSAAVTSAATGSSASAATTSVASCQTRAVLMLPASLVDAATPSIIEADALGHQARGPAVPRDLGQRQLVGNQLAIGGGDRGRLGCGVDRILEVDASIKLLRRRRRQILEQPHGVVAIRCVARD